jgi:hypothetical protein
LSFQYCISVDIDGIGRFQQAYDDVHRFGHHGVELFGGEAKKILVGHQGARSHAENGATAREMIEKRHPLGNVKRMMKRDTDD